MAKKRKAPHTKIVKLNKRYGKILALDMGTKNCAFAVLKGKTLEKVGFITDTVSCLIDHVYPEQASLAIKEIEALINEHQPDAIVMERFQSRGRGGATIEYINVLIGIITTLALQNNIDVRAITAVEWKGQFRRVFDQELDDLYLLLKPFPPHTIDASLQAWYIGQAYNQDNPFTNWKLKVLNKVVKQWRLDFPPKTKRKVSAPRSKSNT